GREPTPRPNVLLPLFGASSTGGPGTVPSVVFGPRITPPGTTVRPPEVRVKIGGAGFDVFHCEAGSRAVVLPARAGEVGPPFVEYGRCGSTGCVCWLAVAFACGWPIMVPVPCAEAT